MARHEIGFALDRLAREPVDSPEKEARIAAILTRMGEDVRRSSAYASAPSLEHLAVLAGSGSAPVRLAAAGLLGDVAAASHGGRYALEKMAGILRDAPHEDVRAALCTAMGTLAWAHHGLAGPALSALTHVAAADPSATVRQMALINVARIGKQGGTALNTAFNILAAAESDPAPEISREAGSLHRNLQSLRPYLE